MKQKGRLKVSLTYLMGQAILKRMKKKNNVVKFEIQFNNGTRYARTDFRVAPTHDIYWPVARLYTQACRLRGWFTVGIHFVMRPLDRLVIQNYLRILIEWHF